MNCALARQIPIKSIGYHFRHRTIRFHSNFHPIYGHSGLGNNCALTWRQKSRRSCNTRVQCTRRRERARHCSCRRAYAQTLQLPQTIFRMPVANGKKRTNEKKQQQQQDERQRNGKKCNLFLRLRLANGLTVEIRAHLFGVPAGERFHSNNENVFALM